MKEKQIVKTLSYRSSLIGDCISALPVLTAISHKFPGAKNVIGIAKKSQVIVPFLENQPLIDEIIISDDSEGNVYTYEGITFNQLNETHLAFVYQVNLNPKVTENDWFNKRDIVCENMRMAFGGEEEYNSLTKQERIPRLIRYFDTKKVESDKPVIFIHLICGHGLDTTRSPSKEFWDKLLIPLKDKFKLVQVGHPRDLHLDYVEDFTNKSFFEQIQYVLGGDLFIGLESGLSWLIMAHNNIPVINLLTNTQQNHVALPLSWVPPSAGVVDNIFEWNGINNINTDKVTNSIFKLLTV